MVEPIVIDKKNASKEDIDRALQLLSQEKTRKARIAAGEIKGGQKWSELSAEQKESRKAAEKRRRARITLLCQKAIEGGITVTEGEIDDYLAA